MEIKEATLQNVPELLSLWKELMDFHSNLDLFFTRRKEGHNNFKKHLIECIKSDNACVYLAVEKEEILGYILAKIQEYPPVFKIENYVEIFDIYIKPSYRRQKVGENLVKNTIDYFKKKGSFRIEMKVASKNIAGINFWKNQGFDEYIKLMYFNK